MQLSSNHSGNHTDNGGVVPLPAQSGQEQQRWLSQAAGWILSLYYALESNSGRCNWTSSGYFWFYTSRAPMRLCIHISHGNLLVERRDIQRNYHVAIVYWWRNRRSGSFISGQHHRNIYGSRVASTGPLKVVMMFYGGWTMRSEQVQAGN